MVFIKSTPLELTRRKTDHHPYTPTPTHLRLYLPHYHLPKL